MWDDVRFPDGHVYEDVEVTFQILNRCRAVLVIDEPLLLNRRHSASITETWTTQNIFDSITSLSHFASFVDKNTQTLFTREQLMRIRLSQLRGLISSYVRILQTDDENKNVIGKELRKEAIKLGNEIGNGYYDVKSKLGYWMICMFPWLLRIVYPLYFRMHSFMKRLQ